MDARIEYITDIKKISKYGLLSTSAVVADGDVKCLGKIKGWDRPIIILHAKDIAFFENSSIDVTTRA